jgi:erythromycin esterase-like protein
MKDSLPLLRREAQPLTDDPRTWDPLVEELGQSRIVLLGEASHGSHEFYRDRARLTRRLIEEKGFRAVATEADWPNAHRAHRYINGHPEDADAVEALAGFKRFPTWLWRNRVVADFLEWLRRFNLDQPAPPQRVGFYGIDLYSLHDSMDAVLQYLEQTDPAAADRARQRYACFEQFSGDPQRYGYQTALGQARDCRDEVVAQLVEMRRQAHTFVERNGGTTRDEFFSAHQNARLIANAEEYYRAMFQGREATWNLRDTHMADTVDEIIDHRQQNGPDQKLIIWAHNSHVGDARATEMGDKGELNLGQLMRERYGDEVALVGWSTYHGSVTAASDWGRPTERKTVRPALPDSYESLFHHTGLEAFFLNLRQTSPDLRAFLAPPRLQRAIGVIYKPETERASHYFRTHLPNQFDIIIHLDRTQAVEPLDRGIHWLDHELPETYPFNA